LHWLGVLCSPRLAFLLQVHFIEWLAYLLLADNDIVVVENLKWKSPDCVSDSAPTSSCNDSSKSSSPSDCCSAIKQDANRDCRL
jgi:hypothetical protein